MLILMVSKIHWSHCWKTSINRTPKNLKRIKSWSLGQLPTRHSAKARLLNAVFLPRRSLKTTLSPGLGIVFSRRLVKGTNVCLFKVFSCLILVRYSIVNHHSKHHEKGNIFFYVFFISNHLKQRKSKTHTHTVSSNKNPSGLKLAY